MTANNTNGKNRAKAPKVEPLEVEVELDEIVESKLSTEVFSFPGGRTVEIRSNENGPVLVVANPDAKTSANLGSFAQNDKRFHRQYLNAIGAWGRFPYEHPLNRYSEDNRLLLNSSAPIEKINGIWQVDEFTADSYIGHVHVGFDPLPLQEAEGLSIPVPDKDECPFNWAVLGAQEDNFFLMKADSPLSQSRKLLAYRAILAGRQVKVVVSFLRPYLEKVMLSWSEPDDAKAYALRSEAINMAKVRRGYRREAAKATYGKKLETVVANGEGLEQTSDELPPVTTIALVMNKKGGGTVNLADLPAGNYTVMDQHERMIIAAGQPWNPQGMTAYSANLWGTYIKRNCVIEVR